MKLDSVFLNNCPLPKSAWSRIYNRTKNETYLVINDQLYCNLFWVYFWYNGFASKYASQTVVLNLPKLDLSEKVVIRERDGEMIGVNKAVENIEYYSSFDKNYVPRWSLFRNTLVSSDTLYTSFVCLTVLITIIVFLFDRFVSRKGYFNNDWLYIE